MRASVLVGIVVAGCGGPLDRQDGPPSTPMDPWGPGVSVAAAVPCGSYANYAGDRNVRAIGGLAADWPTDGSDEEETEAAQWIVLAGGGPAGGFSPMRLDPSGVTHPLLPPLPGTCSGIALATDAPRAAAACKQDPTTANPDGGEEVFLVEPDGVVTQVTSDGVWEQILAVALDASGRHLAYVRQSELWVVDLDAGGLSTLVDELNYAGTITVLRLSDDGSRVLIGSQGKRDLRWYEVTADAPKHDLPVYGSWIYHPEGDFDGPGRLAVWLTSLQIDGSLDDGVELRLRDLDTGEEAQLTQLPEGPPRIASPRLTRDGTRVAFLATAALDPQSMTTDWTAPHVIVIPLEGVGIDRDAPTRDFPLPFPATDLTLRPDGMTAVVRLWYPGYGGASLVEIDLATGELHDLVRAQGTGEIIDLSPDGGFASIRRSGLEPAAALWPTDGGNPVELPWAGAVSRGGARVAALRPAPADGTRELHVYDPATGEDRVFPHARNHDADNLGIAGLLLSEDGGRAIYVTSFDLDRHPVAGDELPGRHLHLIDLDTGEDQLVASGLSVLSNVATLDATGRFVAYWTPVPQPGALPGTRASIVLYDGASGEQTVVYESASWGDGDGALALSPGGGLLAFCAQIGYESPCRLALLDLETGEERSFPGLDVQGSLSVEAAGEMIFVGDTPRGRGLHRFDPDSGRLDRLAPPVMVRAILRGDFCAWNAVDGGAIVARPISPSATPQPVP